MHVIQAPPTDLLAGLAPREIRDALSVANPCSFNPNETLFLEGHLADCLILIETGQVLLSRIGCDGSEVILRVCGPGEIVDMYAESGYRHHTCTARTLTRCSALIWDSKQAFALGILFPQVRTNLIRILAARLHELEERFREIATGKAGPPGLISQPALQASDTPCPQPPDRNGIASMTLADFVRQRFIPEFVDNKRSAGRAHFREILKFILLSENAPTSLAGTYKRKHSKRKAISTWPYMDSLRLCDINPETVQQLTSTALACGYSLQTVTHIRNAFRAIYSYAISACRYAGCNPAALVPLPAAVHRDEHVLSLAELKEVLELMRFPDSAFALFLLLAEINLVEIAGLQWQYVNLSGNAHPVAGDWIPARTIAVRNQWYRGELRPVARSRRRFVSVPDLLCSILRDLRCRSHFTGPQDFVLASQNGSPAYPGNIANRRLKSIGLSCDTPWLSWRVFSRTHSRLKSEYGSYLHKEYAKVLPLQCW